MRSCRSTSSVLVVALLTAVVLTTRADVPAAAFFTRSISLPIVGTVAGQPESVTLAGTIEIANTLVTDENGNAPRQRLSLKLVGVSGAGLLTGATYVATGESSLVRPLAATDRLEIMFPFFRATADGPLSARSAAASIVLNVDLLTGGITTASASFAAPNISGR